MLPNIYFVLIFFFCVNVTVMVQIRDPGMMLLTSGIAPRARRDSWNSTILAADESLGRYVFLGQLFFLIFHELTCISCVFSPHLASRSLTFCLLFSFNSF